MAMTNDALALASADLWCIAPGYKMAANRVAANTAARNVSPQKNSAIAVLQMIGALTKAQMVPLRETIGQLAANPAIAELILLVDSPGGMVAGTHDLSTIISRAAKQKRVTAVVEDCACSGALYAISGATEIVIGETA